MKAVNIIWDVDDGEDKNILPSEIEIPDDMADYDEISDYLSDVTGFCHKGFDLIFSAYDKSYVNNKNPFDSVHRYELIKQIFAQMFNYVTGILYNYNGAYESEKFKCWYYENKWYVLHKPSCTFINWNSDWENSCNKSLTIAQYEKFVSMFLDDERETS